MATRAVILVGALLAAAAYPASFQPRSAPEPVPDVGELMKIVVDRYVEQEERGAELHYESRILTTVHSLDKELEVTETETRLHHRYPLEGELYEELVELDGEPLDADDLDDERERREEFIRDVREREEDDDPIETNDDREIEVETLMDRYEATITGVETIDGEPCWVVSFAPRAGKLPEKTRMDHMLNRSSGTLHVTQRDYGVRLIEFRIRQPTRYFFGIATLRHAAGRLDFERVEPEVWLPQRFAFAMELRVLFRTTRQQVVREWIKRERLEAAAAD